MVSGGDAGGEGACDCRAGARFTGVKKSIAVSCITAGCETTESKRELARYGSSCCTVVLQQECEFGIAEDPQSSLMCWQHSRSASVRVSETRQAISGVPHTHKARASAASLPVQFNTNQSKWVRLVPQFGGGTNNRLVFYPYPVRRL